MKSQFSVVPCGTHPKDPRASRHGKGKKYSDLWPKTLFMTSFPSQLVKSEVPFSPLRRHGENS